MQPRARSVCSALDVAPGQEKEQFAIGPDVFEAEYGPSVTRLDDDERLGRQADFIHTGRQYMLILKNPVNPV